MHPQEHPAATRRAYSIAAFCDAFCVSRSKTYQLLAEGNLQAIKLGRKTLITADEADRWLQSLSESSARER